MAQLDMPANVYNWLVDFFSGHTHCTVYRGQMSTQKSITASIIQGSGTGPASYVINTGDLEVRTLGNKLCKFADDTYLIIPADNADSRSAEIDNIETWARTNNLTLNRTKSKEIVVVDTKRKRQVVSYPTLPGIVRVTSLKVLGVIVTNGLSASDRVRGVITNCAQTLYTLRDLRAHSMRCRSSFGWSSSPSCCMLPVLGGASPMRPTGSESMRSCAAVFVAAYAHLTFFRLKSSARQQTSSSATKY